MPLTPPAWNQRSWGRILFLPCHALVCSPSSCSSLAEAKCISFPFGLFQLMAAGLQRHIWGQYLAQSVLYLFCSTLYVKPWFALASRSSLERDEATRFSVSHLKQGNKEGKVYCVYLNSKKTWPHSGSLWYCNSAGLERVSKATDEFEKAVQNIKVSI